MKSDWGKKASILGACLKKCKNKDTVICDSCLRFSKFKPLKETRRREKLEYPADEGNYEGE